MDIYICDGNIRDLLQGSRWWLYRHVVFGDLSAKRPLETIRPLVENIAEYVEHCKIIGEVGNNVLDTILSGLCSPRATCLRKLSIDGFDGPGRISSDSILPALQRAPHLEELELIDIWFRSVEPVEQLFASMKVLKTLILYNVAVEADKVALAFRLGMQRNDTLIAVHLRDIRDGPFLRGCLRGMRDNRSLREVRITVSGMLSDSTVTILRGFVSSAGSIRRFRFDGSSHAAAEVILGLTSNSSIEEIDIKMNGDFPEPSFDIRLASAIELCSANNTTLYTWKVRGNWLNFPLSQEAVASALRRWKSLKAFHVYGQPVASGPLRHPDWQLMPYGIQNGRASHLKALSLSGNVLSTQNIRTILPRLSSVLELSLNGCHITVESVRLICDFIRNSSLKTLRLDSNPIGIHGAARILEAVSTSASAIERLDLDYRNGSDEDREHNAVDCINSLASGLRESQNLKAIKLPGSVLEFIDILGKALTETHVLETLEVTMPCNYGFLRRLSKADEDRMISFVSMIPQMKSLVCICGLFDFDPSERICDALVAALMENRTLKEIQGKEAMLAATDHVCNNEAVHFYLGLNRLGRSNYLAASGSKPLPSGVLPHWFSRMTKKEYTSQLFYFLRRTSPDVLTIQATASSHKRGAPASPVGDRNYQ